MFSPFKRKARKTAPEKSKQETRTSNEGLIAQAEALQEEINSADGVGRSDLLDQQGGLYQRAGETDRAIASFEASIETTRRMGMAYRGLTTLYSRKRSEAAAAGDDATMRESFDKLQELMQSSKDMLRGK